MLIQHKSNFQLFTICDMTRRATLEDGFPDDGRRPGLRPFPILRSVPCPPSPGRLRGATVGNELTTWTEIVEKANIKPP